jgi:type I restriction enzyme M protein
LEECNLHTIVRLPKSVFAPYTSIATNLLFFTKGTPTKDVWYYEHRVPAGVKNYNKTKPIDYKEFKTLEKWWGTEKGGFKKRKENEQAWKVSVDDIVERGYNLDIKNPHQADLIQHDPEELLAGYQAQQGVIQGLRDQLKSVLGEALSESAGE